MGKFKKIFYVIFRNIIHVFEPFNSKLYMKLYIKLLKKNGMDLKGTPRYISPSVHFDGIDLSLISLGNDVVISKYVEFLTHDFSIARGLQAINKKMTKKGKDEYFLREIKVGNNCFIGLNSILLPGTELGDNVIVGAGSVVRGRFPNDVIIMGNPASIVGHTKDWTQRKLEKGGINCEQ